MNSPLVSVIIPSFNRLDYLLRSIESVFNQTYTKTEVIVINDGSTEEGYLEHKYIKDIKQIKTARWLNYLYFIDGYGRQKEFKKFVSKNHNLKFS